MQGIYFNWHSINTKKNSKRYEKFKPLIVSVVIEIIDTTILK